MCKKLFTVVILALFVVSLFASTRAIGNVIVKFHDETSRMSISEFVEEHAHFEMSEMEVLSPRFNIHLFSFNENTMNEESFLETIQRDSRVRLAQYNHWNARWDECFEVIPNDPAFRDQWHLKNTGQNVPEYGVGTVGADIKATEAW